MKTKKMNKYLQKTKKMNKEILNRTFKINNNFTNH